MRKDVEPTVWGDIPADVAEKCRALNCPLLSEVKRTDPSIPTCAVKMHQEYTVKLESIAIDDYRSRIPEACPQYGDKLTPPETL